MLTFEAPQFTIRGLTIFRDHANVEQFYFLPKSQARVSGGGTGLEFVAYSEDISIDPNFSLDTSRSGGFLTLETELGPNETEIEAIRQELASQTGAGNPILAQVPFKDGTVTLIVLGSRGNGGDTAPSGFEVSIAGSTKPSMFGLQTAVFSTRLGGKAADLLYNTLRGETADPQAVVNYDLAFDGLTPAYNLEIEIDFKKTFEHMRHRVGVNLLVAKADLDFMIQESVNQGSIIIREIDFTGNAGQTPLGAEGGVMNIVRDLLAPTLFNPAPIPTPNYRALPDSASSALAGEQASSTMSIGTSSSATGGDDTKKELTAGEDLKITHTPVSGGKPAGPKIPVTAKFEPAQGITEPKFMLFFRMKDDEEYQSIEMQATTAGETPNPTPADPTPADPAPADPAPADPPNATNANMRSAEIPGQPNGVVVQYYLEATGKKAGQAIKQTLPGEDATKKPLSFRVGKNQNTRQASSKKAVDLNATTLIGYSLRSIDVTEQVKRTFRLDKATAVTRHYYPGGVLSADGIGPNFNPDNQVTHVRLGEGPFKLFIIQVNTAFDFEPAHILSVTLHLQYGRRSATDATPLHSVSLQLNKDKKTGQVQFQGDDLGTQTYSYFVEFAYDPDHLVGEVGAEGVRSPLFEDVADRVVTIELDQHSPILPVKIRSGFLPFKPEILDQVQVRVAPTATSEGQTIILKADEGAGTANIVPADGQRHYFMEQTFFFRDDSTKIDFPESRDTDVVVNLPSDLVFSMIPQYEESTQLVKRVQINARYRHANNDEERATLHLDEEKPSSEFAVVTREGDPKQWSADFRFVMKNGPSLTGPDLNIDISQPSVSLHAANFRVINVELLDTSIFDAGDVLAVKIILGVTPEDPATPSATLLLKSGKTSDETVVPGLGRGDQVNASIEVIRRGTEPTRSQGSVGAFADTLYLAF